MIYLLKGDMISIYLYSLLKDKYPIKLASKADDIKDASCLILPRKGIDIFNFIYGTEIDIKEVINNNPALTKVITGQKNFDFSLYPTIKVYYYLDDIAFQKADIAMQITALISSVTSELLLAPWHISFLVCGDMAFIEHVTKLLEPFNAQISTDYSTLDYHCIITNKANIITPHNYETLKCDSVIYDFSPSPHALSYELTKLIKGKYFLVNNLGSIYYPKSSAILFAKYLEEIL